MAEKPESYTTAKPLFRWEGIVLGLTLDVAVTVSDSSSGMRTLSLTAFVTALSKEKASVTTYITLEKGK